MTNEERALKAALKERGIGSPDAFAERYGAPLDSLTPGEALALLRLPDHPRSRDRATWTPLQRKNYGAGCLRALARLKEWLERGLLSLGSDYSLAVELQWFRLATRAVRIIARMERASDDAGAAFCGSPLGRWFADTDWPTPSPAARLEEW